MYERIAEVERRKMEGYDRRRFHGHTRRIEELHFWRNSREQRIERWWFSTEDDTAGEFSGVDA